MKRKQARSTYAPKSYTKKSYRSSNQKLVDYCKMSQENLKTELSKELNKIGYDQISEPGFLYAKGSVPVLLVAHLDTVHKTPVKTVIEYTLPDGTKHVTSPQGIGGDDRCGVYIIMEIIKHCNCSVLFCEDEEIGGIGAKKFCQSDFVEEVANQNNYIIEFDRMGANDSVFYSCENTEFESFINHVGGFKTAFGSFSDISFIAPATTLSAVNLSSAYYNAHRKSEYINLNELEDIIERAKKLIYVSTEVKSYSINCDQRFDYIEDDYKLFDCRGNYYNTNVKSEEMLSCEYCWDYFFVDDMMMTDDREIICTNCYDYCLGARKGVI